MNISAVTKISNFFVSHEAIFKKAGLIGAEIIIGAVLQSKYDIPITVGTDLVSVSTKVKNDDFEFEDLDLLFKPKNSTAAAILSTTKHAKTLWSDYRKVEAASDIYKLIDGKDVDDSTKEYAVLCMGKIREMIDSDYRKREVQKLIMDLMTK